MEEKNRYVPALRFGWLTRFYDPVLQATLKEERFKRLLVSQAGVRLGAEVVGLDGDPQVLALARKKAEAAGLDVEFREGMAYDPPFPPRSFDRVVSSLVLHHLTTRNKQRALAAICALLRPGGELHVADWGQAQNPLMRLAFLGVQFLDGFDTTTDNVRGRLIPLMTEAGFHEVAEIHREMTVFGTLSLYRAVRP